MKKINLKLLAILTIGGLLLASCHGDDDDNIAQLDAELASGEVIELAADLEADARM